MFCNTNVSISVAARDLIKLSSLRTYPSECCGFLWGHRGMISIAMEAENVSASDKFEHFEINASAFIAAEKFADVNGLTLMGVFHSHPDTVAIPSDIDRESALPNFLYLITAVSSHVVQEERLWILDDCGHFKELCLQGALIESSNQKYGNCNYSYTSQKIHLKHLQNYRIG